MQMIARIYIPLMLRSKWPKVNIAGVARRLVDAFALYVKAVSAAYGTALFLDERNERLPGDDLDGRDPDW